jgi:hypothetical protein
MVIVSRDVHGRYRSPHAPGTPQKSRIYTPTPEGFERFMRAWVNLPTHDVPMHDVTTHRAADASALETPRRNDHEEGQ